MAEKRSNLIDVGQLAGVFGVKGWIKVKSSTEPKENILQYSPWWLKTRHGVKPFEVDEYNVRSDDLIVHFKGVDDRDEVAQYTLVNIAVERDQLPELEAGDYYWHQLIGLKVISQYEGQSYEFGHVKKLIETGANDVLVVKAEGGNEERLIPYVLEQFVKHVDLEAGEILVEWDPEF